MKIKLLSLMCISMMFMGCDLFGPSCEDLLVELEAAAETYLASALTGTAGHEDCDAYADKTKRNGKLVTVGYVAGFGSNTTTKKDGTVIKIKKGMKVTTEEALRDLNRRITKLFISKL